MICLANLFLTSSTAILDCLKYSECRWFRLSCLAILAALAKSTLYHLVQILSLLVLSHAFQSFPRTSSLSVSDLLNPSLVTFLCQSYSSLYSLVCYWVFSERKKVGKEGVRKGRREGKKGGKKEIEFLFCSICRFPWCKWMNYGQFQATYAMPLKTILRRDVKQINIL